MIQFTIRLLRSATGTTHYVAQTHSLGTLTLEALTDHLLERNPIGGRAAIQAVLTTFFASARTACSKATTSPRPSSTPAWR